MIKTLLSVALGGAIGTILRYLLQRGLSNSQPGEFPTGTFTVNLIGCFIIGLLWGLSEKSTSLSENWKLFLFTGVCGGFTTFSAYSQDALLLFREGRIFLFFLYAGGTLVIGFLLTWLGYYLTK